MKCYFVELILFVFIFTIACKFSDDSKSDEESRQNNPIHERQPENIENGDDNSNDQKVEDCIESKAEPDIKEEPVKQGAIKTENTCEAHLRSKIYFLNKSDVRQLGFKKEYPLLRGKNEGYLESRGMTKDELEAHRINVKNGLLYSQNNKLITGSGKYVISPDRKLYLKRHNYRKDFLTDVFIDYGSDKGTAFFHTLFLHKGPVISAGWIRVEEGRLVCIDNASGHYQPNKQNGLNAISVLVNELKVEIDKYSVLAVIDDFDNNMPALCEGWRKVYRTNITYTIDSYGHSSDWDCSDGFINLPFPVTIYSKTGDNSVLDAYEIKIKKYKLVKNGGVLANGTYHFASDSNLCLFTRSERDGNFGGFKELTSLAKIKIVDGRIQCFEPVDTMSPQSTLHIESFLKRYNQLNNPVEC